MKKIFLLITCFGFSILKAQNTGISKQDKEFAEYALNANITDLKFSEMAMNKGFSPEVKELAQHILTDQKNADDLLKKITAGKSIFTPTILDEEHQNNFTKLSDKEGEAFDKAYTECMLKSHKKTIDIYEKETKKGENTELRAFATNTLPSLNNYKNLADQTCKKLNKK